MKDLPAAVAPYKRTPTFSQQTVPAGLLNAHQTKPGTWGRIVVLEGRLKYRILEPQLETQQLSPDRFGVVEPQVKHEVEPDGPVQFYVEFYR